ncbi:MAG TPA: glycosyltransferase family 4 protein [Streptosporangiaceae bacterium]|nr:glycosyltransferase family 4 protein [Streptosporangiaceae bacterium]
MNVKPLARPTGAVNGRRLRIAMVAPPYFTVPPAAYGGVESVIADLVDALVDRGHEVTLVGAGERLTRAQIFIATYHTPPAEQLGEPLPEVTHSAHVGRVLDDLPVDVVHDHTLAGPLLARGRPVPTVVTAHGPVDGDLGTLYRALRGSVSLVAISNSQRSAAPDLPWVATVYNAIDHTTFPFQTKKEEFALFLGRFHPHKAPHLAIDAARRAGLPIVLAGKCAEPIEKAYFQAEIEPRLGADTTMFGVADAAAKRDLLARAACLVFPICWEEPFGLVMIEAMAAGTPVVALRRGSVPEVVKHGVTGIVVDDPDQLATAIEAARGLDPARCRQQVAERFSVPVMAAGYEAAYRQVLARQRAHRDVARLPGRHARPNAGARVRGAPASVAVGLATQSPR